MVKKRWLTREIVVETAARLADEHGDAAAVSLTTVAAALNIRTPSLYNHIDGVDDLLQALAIHGMEQLLSDIRAAVVGLIGKEALKAIGTAYIQFARAHPGLYSLTIRAPEQEEERLVELSTEMLQLMRLVLGSIGIEGDDAIHAIRGFRGILHGFASLETSGGFKMALDTEESFYRLISTYLNGLEPNK